MSKQNESVTVVVWEPLIYADYESPMKSDILTYQCDGLNIYIRKHKGSSIGKLWPAIDHQVQLICLAHHKPLIALHRVGGMQKKKSPNKRQVEAQRKMKDMFDGEI